jgi:hypothetical protein
MDSTTISQLRIGLFGSFLAVVVLLLTKTRILDVLFNVSFLSLNNLKCNAILVEVLKH